MINYKPRTEPTRFQCGKHVAYAYTMEDGLSQLKHMAKAEERYQLRKMLEKYKYGHVFNPRNHECDCGLREINWTLGEGRERCPVMMEQILKKDFSIIGKLEEVYGKYKGNL